MKLITLTDQGNSEENFSKKGSLRKLHQLGEKYLSQLYDSLTLTTDMDGVLIYDDAAVTPVKMVGGPAAAERYWNYSKLNTTAVSEGHTSYCWYSPAVFAASLFKGFSTEINRVVGQKMRLIPGTQMYIDLLQSLKYDITTVTAGHQEGAEEVSRRLGIERTIGTQLGVTDGGLYDGTIERFIGGDFKLKQVQKLLKNGTDYLGIHIGDSWSDVNTLAGIPNSIAFNPGCELALKHARISIIGVSKVGLIPLFDYTGQHDSKLREEDLPEAVIVREGKPSQEDFQRLLKLSQEVKKDRIGKILDRKETLADIETQIRQALVEQEIDHDNSGFQFMSPEDFDQYAKQKYLELVR